MVEQKHQNETKLTPKNCTVEQKHQNETELTQKEEDEVEDHQTTTIVTAKDNTIDKQSGEEERTLMKLMEVLNLVWLMTTDPKASNMSCSLSSSDDSSTIPKEPPTDTKHCILVMMHFTSDPNYRPDSRRFAEGRDMFIVDCLFHEKGLLQCPTNNEAVEQIIKILGDLVQGGGISGEPKRSTLEPDPVPDVPVPPVSNPPSHVTPDVESDVEPEPQLKPTVIPGDKYQIEHGSKSIRFSSHIPPKVKGLCEGLLTSLHAEELAGDSAECDVILAFCPVVSRLGTDVEAALKEIPGK
ncbi:uncharacterized protein LOC134468191 [Engraulis encrasicolus]|uniref:uncharacterized protein LOC134468191 n=1 Tax=Engraulis encrasicolus TaxID=184585 RepID=UPI002FD554B3